MKGAVFSGFAEFIEQHYGLATWQAAIEHCHLSSKGEYLATELYDDSEFFQVVNYLNEHCQDSVEDIQRKFGKQFFTTLYSLVKKQISEITDLFDFLRAVDNVIHVEVQKADPLAYTPTLLYDQPSTSVLIIRYVSHRKMCFFAEGLILGAAEYFQQSATISQNKCLCKGDEHCLIRIEI